MTLKAKAVLIDLAGVLHTGDQVVPGAVDALQRLRCSGLPLRFLTNTTRSPSSTIIGKLNAMGFDIHAGEVQTAVLATRKLVEMRGLKPHYLVHPAIAEEIGPSHTDPDVVVLGDAGPYFTYDALNTAFRWLMGGLPLIAMARNRYYMDGDGLALDMGAYVVGLEYCAGVKAEIVGKPARPFFETALADMGVAPQDAVLIGDDLVDDIAGAQSVGIPSVLVRTGKFRATDERHPEIQPACIVDDFPAAVDMLLS
ncbi:MAG TPA: TIGR01458 family HAD-type hydrolase [Rhodocyclaceae bacterium]|nr:TIGR01458 family HAD-type hydrolase [Rhodocyclaceae bacterium]